MPRPNEHYMPYSLIGAVARELTLNLMDSLTQGKQKQNTKWSPTMSLRHPVSWGGTDPHGERPFYPRACKRLLQMAGTRTSLDAHPLSARR